MRAIILSPFIAATLMCAALAAGAAPTPGIPAQYAQSQPSAPSGSESTIPQQTPRSGSSAAPGSLSHQLSRSGGVIHPPPSGDSGVVAPPNQGASRTPVIPPPGTPGGNPMVQPK
ncbi:MAG TPA: hypothetical protein VNV18_03575 [Stellaceae bacterium]|jgi:hypothetical protein|nr:hypothetical protein [Stellaceae bacterium]